MLKKVLIGVGALLVVFIIVVAMQPSTYRVERSLVVDAPADVVFAEVSDFNKWEAWNPWKKMDPTQTDTVEGTPGTVGHKTSWKGDETGSGSMTVTEIKAPNLFAMDLEFKEPMDSKAKTAFELADEGGKTKVTWSMDGNNNFMGKLFGMMMNIDEMVGSEYEKGLAGIKTIAEANAKKAAEVAAAAPTEEATEEAATE